MELLNVRRKNGLEDLKEDKDWNILEKQTNLVNRPKPQLEGKHRVHLLSFYDENPQARLVDAMNSLTRQFENINIHKSSVENRMLFFF